MASKTFAPLLVLALLATTMVHAQQQQELPADQRQLVDAALPSTAPAKPKQRRTLLVVTTEMRDGKPTQGPSYPALPVQNYALEQMGKRTGAYDVVFSSHDNEVFRPGRIEQFDAICFCNSLGVLFDDPELKKSLMDFVANGKGIIGIHDGLATFVQYPRYDQWPEFGQMLGGTENGGHPWNNVEMTIRVEDANHPINAAFGGKSFTIVDQAFQLQEPTFRDRLRVLVSIDVANTSPTKRIFKTRTEDLDFPMSWIKTHGKGRVFYSAFGHGPTTFQNGPMLQHFLAGIQYALGDLEADATPRPQPAR